MNVSKKFARHSKGTNVEKIRGPTTRRTSPRGLIPHSKSVRSGASPRSKSTNKVDPLHRTEQQNNKTQFPHFRYHKKSRHPALITGEQKDIKQYEEWKYRKVMHSEKDGRHINEKIYPNPDPSDEDAMYIAKRVRTDNKKYFSQWTYPWEYPKQKRSK